MCRSQVRSHPVFFSGMFALLLLAARPEAAERPSLFEEANRYYEQGNYTEAINHYEGLVKAGRNSAAVFFNLGNACFKQGELGRALFNYRKAEAIAPRDPDIQANLRFTRERVSGTLSVRTGPVHRVLSYFTLNELATVAGILLWIWAAIFCATRLRPGLKPSLRTPQLVLGILLASTLCLIVAAGLAKRSRTVIVTSRQATVHLGPLPESQSAFAATDGTELRLLESRPDWLQVSDRSGRAGWIRAADATVF